MLLSRFEGSFPICRVTDVVIIRQIGDDQPPQLGHDRSCPDSYKPLRRRVESAGCKEQRRSSRDQRRQLRRYRSNSDVVGAGRMFGVQHLHHSGLFVGIVDADRHQIKSAVAVHAVHGFEVRQLFATGAAPCCPEIHQQ